MPGIWNGNAGKLYGIIIIMMLRSKDALRIVTCFALPQSYTIFAYRGAIAPLRSELKKLKEKRDKKEKVW